MKRLFHSPKVLLDRIRWELKTNRFQDVLLYYAIGILLNVLIYGSIIGIIYLLIK